MHQLYSKSVAIVQVLVTIMLYLIAIALEAGII